MSNHVPKGANFSLSKLDPALSEVLVALSWKTNPPSGQPLEIDVSAFVLGKNGKTRGENDFIFYNQPSGAQGAVRLVRIPVRTAGNDGSPGSITEQQGFLAQLSKLSPDIDRIVFCLTINEAETRGQSFRLVESMRLRAFNLKTKQELAYCRSGPDFNSETAVLVGEIYRHRDEWKLRAIEQGFSGGLAAMAVQFGVAIDQTSSPETDLDSGAGLDSSTQADAASASAAYSKTPATEVDPKAPVQHVPVKLRKKRSTHALLTEQKTRIRGKIKTLWPNISRAIANSASESDTRLVLNQVFHQALDFRLEEIQTEKRIQGLYADYVLTPKGGVSVVVEVKKVGLKLNSRHVTEAATYAAFSGIPWALVTNLVSWQLYRVTTDSPMKVEPHLVFSFELQHSLDDRAAHCLSLLSRFGLQKKTLLERVWTKKHALSEANVTNAILSSATLKRIRAQIIKNGQCKVHLDDIENAIRKLLKLDQPAK